VSVSDERFDWDDLRYVLAVARGGSLGAAARDLGVNHSSVYRRMAALESRLAVRLFERRRDSYQLTLEGEMLASAATRMESEALAARRRVLGTDLKLSGIVRVSTGDLLGYHLLPPLLTEFPLRYPDVEIELSINNRPVDLTRRDADLVVRATDRPPEHLIGRRISRMASSAYAHRDYLTRMGRGRDLDQYDWLGLDDSLSHLPQARWLRERVPKARCRLRFDAIEAARQCARSGLGAAVLPCFVGDIDPDLERMTEPETSGEFGVWVLTHPDLRRSARIRAFMNEIGSMIATRERHLLGVAA